MDEVEFKENAVYTTEQVAKIIHRNTKTVRALCKRGDIPAKCDRGGYLITGWMLRAYLENRICVKEP
ncbi:MAG: helix-turn-helix domain-containing protein [Lentisphaeria bacterium]|nr:helix-turn-helix domain-containing protein [Lentisphaeria bacterium]